MAKMPATDKPLIAPVYRQDSPSDPIDLGKVAVEFECEDKTYHETAQVTLWFRPDERLLFSIPQEGKHPLFGFLFDNTARNMQLRLVEKGVTLEAFSVGSAPDGEGPAVMPTKSVVTVTPESDELTAGIVHLFNFPDFHGPDGYVMTNGEPPFQERKACGCAILRADGWVITIAAIADTDKRCKTLRAEGGYLITHMGRIERNDGGTFSGEQLEDLLRCLHYFTSFTLGRWAGVALPIGFDTAGERVFEAWGLPSVASGHWNGGISWFDDRHGELLSQIFPGFMTLWNDEQWRSALTRSLYWYLRANQGGAGLGVDTGLILAQAALEALAWVYCVQCRKMVSPTAFGRRGLSAADKLRLLASALEIPLELPSHLSALNHVPGRKWVDAMDAITGIRNTLVHPNVEKEFAEGSYYEAWALSLWYIDMVLLRLCSHNGKYGNRLAKNRWAGQVEDVPWTKTTPGSE